MNIRGRAATPATVFLLAAFVLLLLSCISVPITKSIALGSFNGVTFGVFGFCIKGSGCSPVQLGYNPDKAIQSATGSSPADSKRSLLPRQGPPNDFSLPPSARSGLSNILIVHVLAAALTFVTLILSLIAHIRSPSHSVRFLLAIFIIQILTTILTLLSFLVDLLVFVPHFASGTWLVLAATICNAVATILLCCGRRTLVGRKAMRRRIAENADKNYFTEEIARENAIRLNDQGNVRQYAELEISRPRSPDRLPLNPLQTRFVANSRADPSDPSGETMSTKSSLPGSFRTGLPSGPSPYGGGGYSPAVRMPHSYGPVPPVRTASDRRYPPTPPTSGKGVPPLGSMEMGMSSSRPIATMNRPPRSNYEPPLPPPGPVAEDKHASSVYSDYIPPRRQWAAAVESLGLDDEYSDNNRYRPERPKIDTSNLDRNDRMVDNSYDAARRTPEINPVPIVRTSDSGTIIPSYYEDVDPRFDDNPEDLEALTGYGQQPPPQRQPPHRRPSRPPDLGDERLPSSPSPLRRNYSYNSADGRSSRANDGANGGNNIDDESRSGPRSPAASTSSHFTSVSQRGVNPRWQAQAPQFIGENSNANDGMYSRRNRPPRNDQMNLLAGNPDFELPASRSGRRGPVQITSPIDAGGRYPVPR